MVGAFGCAILGATLRDSPFERPLLLVTVLLAFASPRLTDRTSVQPPATPAAERKLRGVKRLSIVGMLVGLMMAVEFLFLFGPTPVVIALAARSIALTGIAFVAMVAWQNVAAEGLYRSLAATATQQI
jgi:hypothetical protein